MPGPLDLKLSSADPNRAGPRTVSALQIADQVRQYSANTLVGKQAIEGASLDRSRHRSSDRAVESFRAAGCSLDLPYEADPISLFSELLASDEKQRITERSLVHGDLHMSNVALDIGLNGPQAYIFDAGVVKRNVAGRDIAVIEASVPTPSADST